MKQLIHGAIAATFVAASATVALAQSSTAPGQDRVCLVTSKNPNSFNDTDVSGTKWLPRKAAEAQASKDPTTLRVFDYSKDPLVTGGTYASAEDLCNKHFTNSPQVIGVVLQSPRAMVRGDFVMSGPQPRVMG